jgi:hypothetical protein
MRQLYFIQDVLVWIITAAAIYKGGSRLTWTFFLTKIYMPESPNTLLLPSH